MRICDNCWAREHIDVLQLGPDDSYSEIDLCSTCWDLIVEGDFHGLARRRKPITDGGGIFMNDLPRSE